QRRPENPALREARAVRPRPALRPRRPVRPVRPALAARRARGPRGRPESPSWRRTRRARRACRSSVDTAPATERERIRELPRPLPAALLRERGRVWFATDTARGGGGRNRAVLSGSMVLLSSHWSAIGTA